MVRKIIDMWPNLNQDPVFSPQLPTMALRKNPCLVNKIIRSKPPPVTELQTQNTGHF